MKSDTPPATPAVELIPKTEHIALQHEFLKLAQALGVTIADGMSFPEAFDRCRKRAATASVKAESFENVLALLDGCRDSVSYAAPTVTGVHRQDLERALKQLDRALVALRALAGKEGK